jgi:hypothetical protein
MYINVCAAERSAGMNSRSWLRNARLWSIQTVPCERHVAGIVAPAQNGEVWLKGIWEHRQAARGRTPAEGARFRSLSPTTSAAKGALLSGGPHITTEVEINI